MKSKMTNDQFERKLMRAVDRDLDRCAARAEHDRRRRLQAKMLVRCADCGGDRVTGMAPGRCPWCSSNEATPLGCLGDLRAEVL